VIHYGDDGRSADVYASLEDQPAALSPSREERAADGLQKCVEFVEELLCSQYRKKPLTK
jgi:hypothetical protein